MDRVYSSPVRRFLVLVVLLQAAAAGAQDRRWEIEGAVGVVVAQPTSAGSVTLPPAGPAIVTSLPTFPSRAVPSWFFGDGASLLNGALGDFGIAARIAPLDAVLAPLPVAHRATVSVRVRRWLNARAALEIGFDGLARPSVRTGDLDAGVDAAATSFASAFTALLGSGPFARPSVVSGTDTHVDPAHDAALTVAFNRDIGRLGGMQPYITAGGGVVFAGGFRYSGSLQGHYSAAILGEVPIDETDRASMTVTRSTTYAIVAGGGLSRELSPKWSLRVDARMLVGPDSTRIHLDATPSVTRGAPAGFIESFTNPAIQFSNDPAIGRVSSLSGAPLSAAEVFKGGWVGRTTVGVTVARRF